MRPRILLTGAAGRVGQRLAPILRQSFSLRLCDIQPVPHPSAEDELFQGNLADPELTVRAATGVAGIVHLAGLVASQVSFEDTLEPNYRALLVLLDTCRRLQIPRFVFASSHHIVGLHPSGQIYDESAPIAPDGFYGLSKAFGEAACAMYALRFGIRTLVIRIGNVDPQVVDARRERLWVSARDLAHLVTIGLTHPGLTHEIVYGVSRCPSPMFSNGNASRLGYQPQDDARDNHAPSFRPEDFPHLGGSFALDPLN